MKKNLQRLISIIFLSFVVLIKTAYAAEVTIGFDEPIKSYIKQTGKKNTWYYMIKIEYPNQIKLEYKIPNNMALSTDRARLPNYDLANSDRPFKIKLTYGHIITNILYEHDLNFFIPEDKLKEGITKIRIFLNLNMSDDNEHMAKIARVEYVASTNSAVVDANPLSKTIDE